MPALEHTSVPGWVTGEPAVVAPSLDAGGSSYLLVAVGTEGAAAAARLAHWSAEAAPRAAQVILRSDAAAASAALTGALGEASVGVRVAVTGSVADCLALRAAAVRAGLEDDELQVAPVAGGPLTVHCIHCGADTTAEAAIDDVVACVGCGVSLLVYYHVSRRTGRFLGFQVDAEEVAS